jgi:hypothetical protein
MTPMKPYLLLALVALTLPASPVSTPARAQGTFTYTFSGDNTPWNVWATFTVPQQNVADSGGGWFTSLNITDVTSGNAVVKGQQWYVSGVHMDVDPLNGTPMGGTVSVSYLDYTNGLSVTDSLDIEGGVDYARFFYFENNRGGLLYPDSAGRWSVSYTSVPEPGTIALLGLATAGLLCARRRVKWPLLGLLVGALSTMATQAQGTFTYTFAGDNSPLHVGITFNASQQAVLTGLLTETNITDVNITVNGQKWSLGIGPNPDDGYESLIGTRITVDKTYGRVVPTWGFSHMWFYGPTTNPIDDQIGWVQWCAFNSNDFDYEAWYGAPWNPSSCSSAGRWSVSYSVPEPSSAVLVGLAMAGLLCISRRVRRPLLGLLLALTATSSWAQGTFTYTFSGDTSPWHIWATFNASQQAVATGLLTRTNISDVAITVNGEPWKMGMHGSYDATCPGVFMEVDPSSGQIFGWGSHMWTDYLWCYTDNNTFDWIRLAWSGTTPLVYYYEELPTETYQSFLGGLGQWSMSYTSVPEPSSAALLGLGALGGLGLLRRAQAQQSR